jgi:hypothetical protein
MKRGAKAGASKTTQPKIGLVEWFRPGEYERVETVLAEARTLDIKELRESVGPIGTRPKATDGMRGCCRALRKT